MLMSSLEAPPRRGVLAKAWIWRRGFWWGYPGSVYVVEKP